MSEVLRAEIRNVLEDWQQGRITCQAVQHWARGASAANADPYIKEVVSQFRGLGEYLITVEDIPVYLDGLAMTPEEGIEHLEKAGARFDVKARATDLKDDPFYGPHTKAILRELM
jgi:hypothetical protein